MRDGVASRGDDASPITASGMAGADEQREKLPEVDVGTGAHDSALSATTARPSHGERIVWRSVVVLRPAWACGVGAGPASSSGVSKGVEARPSQLVKEVRPREVRQPAASSSRTAVRNSPRIVGPSRLPDCRVRVSDCVAVPTDCESRAWWGPVRTHWFC